MPDKNLGTRLADWIATETQYLHLASTGSSCEEVRTLVFQRLGEAIERNGAASSAVSGILDELENQHRHRSVSTGTSSL